MRIVVAESAGFCFGVQRAVALTEELVKTRARGQVVTVGPLCHSAEVVSGLRSRGVEPIDPEAGPGAVAAGTAAVVRSHGLPVEAVARLHAAGAEVHDGTCPYVRSAQTIARRMAGEGYAILVVGEAGHPELISILSHARAGSAPRAAAIADAREIAGLLEGVRKAAVLAQTTAARSRWREVVAACLEAGPVEVRAFDTLCEETERRQREAAELAAIADVVLVVGGRASANARRLAEVCAERCPRCHQLETVEELEPSWLQGAGTVAVTAGASTPAASVSAIVERLHQLEDKEARRR